jgi:transposase-like protein
MSEPAPLAAAAPASHKRKYHTHSDDIRACVLKMRAAGMSSRDIEGVTSVPRATVQRWVRE